MRQSFLRPARPSQNRAEVLQESRLDGSVAARSEFDQGLVGEFDRLPVVALFRGEAGAPSSQLGPASRARRQFGQLIEDPVLLVPSAEHRQCLFPFDEDRVPPVARRPPGRVLELANGCVVGTETDGPPAGLEGVLVGLVGDLAGTEVVGEIFDEVGLLLFDCMRRPLVDRAQHRPVDSAQHDLAKLIVGHLVSGGVLAQAGPGGRGRPPPAR